MLNKQTTLYLAEQKKYFIYFCLVTLVFIYPIIHANIYFLDDIHRIESGYYHWSDLGRHLATFITSIVSLSGFEFTDGGGLADIAPLSQLLSAVFLALSSFVFFNYLVKTTRKKAFWLSALVALNPFFLSNLLFRYDSLGMSLAFLLITLAFFHNV